jgi:hypothetical protein
MNDDSTFNLVSFLNLEMTLRKEESFVDFLIPTNFIDGKIDIDISNQT